MGGQPDQITTKIRYADYIENKHASFLFYAAIKRAGLVDASPYTTYDEIEIEDAFFGAGYAMDSFPSLYDMYGKFMAGLDIEILFDEVFEESVNGTAINNLVSAKSTELSDEIEQNVLPRFETGLRDINSVISSSFVNGRSILEATRLKELSKFSAEARYKMIPVAFERWKVHLDWNKFTVETYAQLMKLYISAKMDIQEQKYDMAMKNSLWPMTVLQYEGACLGILNGARNIETPGGGPSKVAKTIGGSMQGASIGSMFGPWGTAIGGVAGGIAGYLS